MNHPSEFDLYRQLQDHDRSSPAEPEAQARLARMQADVASIANALRDSPEPNPDLLIARVRRTLAAEQRKQRLRRWLPVGAVASVLLILGAISLLSPHSDGREPQQPLLSIAVQQQLQGQAQLLILVEQQPERFTLQASLAQELLRSQTVLTRFAEGTSNQPLQQHCEQMDAILRLIANTDRPLPDAIRKEIRDRDLRFHAEALALAPIART